MKKWLWLIFAAAFMITTTACSSSGGGEEESMKKLTRDGKTVVTLSLRTSGPFYESLKKKFEEKYPDIELDIKSYKNARESWGAGEYEKYIKTTNTAMLSGKGADIIELSGLPIDDYIGKKLLLNMNDNFEQDQALNKNDMQIKILESLNKNGGKYRIPSGFGIAAFVGDGEAIKSAGVNIDDKSWNWNTFEKISKQLIRQTANSSQKQRYAVANVPPDMILGEMVVDNYAQFVDGGAKKAKFDSPEFVELMQQIRSMYDEKIMTSEQADMGGSFFTSISFMSPKDLIDGLYSTYDSPALLQKPHTGQAQGTRIFPLTEFAIRASSPVKDEAWKFITFLLSDEAQSLQDREGFSLLSSVNDKKLNELHEQVKSGTYKLPDGKATQVSDEAFAKFKQYVHSADQYVDVNGKIIPIIGEESAAFFNGQKSAEEVAKLIQNRVTTYLNE